MSRRWRTHGAWLGILLLVSGCAGLSTRFDQNVTTSFAHDKMRKFETDQLELYYPAQYHDEAMRVAGRMDACVRQLRTLPRSGASQAKVVVYLTSAEFNNAYVQPQTIGYPQQMVVAHHMTLELFNWFELGGSEIGDITCHESVHYVQMLETSGFWKVINLITGGIWQPNIFTESWFLEGLATHYEGRLGKDTGRPSSPIWRGMFESGVSERLGELNPGDLSPENRSELPFGGNYLVGMQFVDYLARTYGEDRLWKLVDLQGNSIFSPLAVTLRFHAIYGKDLGSLFSDFTAELKKTMPPRPMPPNQQRLLQSLGYFARAAASPADGAVAVMTAERDHVTRLTVRERDGRIRFSKPLTLVLPGRRYVSMDPELVSGMTFTGDGRWLYFVNVDTGSVGEDQPRLFQVDARTGDVGRIWENIRGLGGGVSPDGTRYLFTQQVGDTANVMELTLETDQRRQLTNFSGRASLGGASYAPDGERIAFSRFTGEGFDLFVRTPDGAITQVTHDGNFNYGARWVDTHRLVFMHEWAGRSQVSLLDLSTGLETQVTDAPFIAFDPMPLGNEQLAFVNRKGWEWTLDQVPLQQVPGTAVVRASEPSPQVDPTANDDPPAPPGVDTRYHALDHLFVPELRAPWAYALPSANGWIGYFGTILTGSDRLGLHNWAINVSYETDVTQPSFGVGYANYQLAPWLLTASVGHNVVPGIRDWSANISASRSFWTSPVNLGFTALQRQEDGLNGATSQIRLIAPSISASYAALEGTPMAGIRRGIALDASATVYSHVFGSDADFGDISGDISLYVPIPGLLRQTFLLSARGRSLTGLPSNVRLLTVGGIAQGFYELHSRPDHTDGGPSYLLPGIAFSESLRGYEDYLMHARSAGIFNARWRYPFVFDKGTASTLWLFPSWFARQLDVEAFGSAARLDSAVNAWHRAVGAAAFFRMTFGQALPVSLFYQFAYRFDDGLAPLHVVGLSFE